MLWQTTCLLGRFTSMSPVGSAQLAGRMSLKAIQFKSNYSNQSPWVHLYFKHASWTSLQPWLTHLLTLVNTDEPIRCWRLHSLWLGCGGGMQSGHDFLSFMPKRRQIYTNTNISRLTMRANGRYFFQQSHLNCTKHWYFISLHFVFNQGFDKHLSAMTHFREPWPLWFGFVCCFFLFCWPTGGCLAYKMHWCWHCNTIKAYIPAY